MLARHCLCSGVGSNSMSVGGSLGGARTSLRNTVFNERLVITTVPRALLQSGSGGYWISVDGAACDCEAAQCAASRGASILAHATPIGHLAANSRSLMNTTWEAGHGARFGCSHPSGWHSAVAASSGPSLHVGLPEEGVSARRRICALLFARCVLLCRRCAMVSAALGRLGPCPALLWTGHILALAASSASQM